MSTYNWNGSTFDGQAFMPSGFFTDSSGTTYFWEQNYRAFFPVLIPHGTPTYAGNGTGIPLPANTFLTTVDNLTGQISTFNTSILTTRQTNYQQDTSKILDAVTQSPTTLVQNALSNAVANATASNANLQTAITGVTHLLNDPNLNFALKDIQTSWPGGEALITKLNDFVSNHQANIADVQNKVQKVLDFKQKLIGQVTKEADRLRVLQGQIDDFKNQGTLSALVAAYPISLGPVQKLLDNQDTFLSNEITKLLPFATAAVNSIASSLFTQVLGSSLPSIINPIDKIFNDINKLSDGAQSILNKIPIDGFGSLAAQTNVVNQVASLLNNVASSIPVVPTLPVVPPLSDSAQINAALLSYAREALGNVPNSPLLAQLAAIATLIGQQAPTVPNAPAVDPADASKGGSFLNNSVLSSAALSLQPNIPAPTTLLSPDPQIAKNQESRNVAQTTADESSTTRSVKRGDCINNINDVPLKPRSKRSDGSIGTYMGSKNIPF